MRAQELFSSDREIEDSANYADLESLRPLPPLFQAGCLTVDKAVAKKRAIRRCLRFPSLEAESLMLEGAPGLKDGWLPAVKAFGPDLLKPLAALDAEGFGEAFSKLLGQIPADSIKPEDGYCQKVLLTAPGLAGQSFDSEGLPEKGVASLTIKAKEGAGLAVKTRRLSGGREEGQSSPGREGLSEEEMSERMRIGAREALDQIEEGKWDPSFSRNAGRICKRAVTAGGSSKALAAFEEMRYWG
ncbi:MAG: hypothetical protein LBE49_07345 [Deltaproteobacteria bacterium]|nr:hypothetical protein [Deltaproteobacteria bacterium]